MADMHKASEQEKAQTNEKLSSIDQRFQSDPAFAAKLKADPIATLKAEGVPEGAILAIQHHAAKKRGDVPGDDVSGYYYYGDDGYIYDYTFDDYIRS